MEWQNDLFALVSIVAAFTSTLAFYVWLILDDILLLYCFVDHT